MTQNKTPILNPNLLLLSFLIPLSLVILPNARLLPPLSLIHEVGDVCNDLDRCVEGTFCDPDGLCSCPEPGSQVFDTYRKKCVAQVFENCESSEDCTQFASCIPQWNQTLARFFGKCQCTGKYFKLPFESICGPRSKFGEPCNEHVNDINFQPCDLSQNLRCRGGQRNNGIPYGSCLCENNATYVFDDYRRACVVRAGHPCFSQRSNHPASICVHGAKCQHFQKRLEKKGEMSSSSSSSSSSRNKALLKSKSTKEFLPHPHQPSGSGSLRCRCEAGFSKTAQGFCKPSFGGRCDHQRNECLEGTGLVCSNGECQCESPLYQIFDERVGKCLCKIGAACHRHNISSHHQQHLHSCVRHAHCHADVSEETSSTTTTTTAASVLLEGSGSNLDKSSASISLGECKCNPGFIKTLDGQCKLDYGSNCSLVNSNSNVILGPIFEFVGDHIGSGLRWMVQGECNNDVGLACQNGKCVCFDSKLVFDEEARICVNRRADEFCGIFRDEMSGSDYRVGCMKSSNNIY